MIVVTTGVPGAGKTLWAITWVKAKAEKENRPVYYSGIADLKLPWIECDPQKWMDCPPNSIIVIDECQRVFRPRAHGSNVPDFVAKLETHRHMGVDIVLITQHPMLIDSNVRRLCGLHFHVVRSWGRAKATVHEWPTIKENCDKNGQREDSVRHEFSYPKANFGLYKSAEVHTHKARIPYHVWFIALVPVVVGYTGWRVYNNWFPKAKQPAVEQAIGPLATVQGGVQPGQVRPNGPLTAAQYIEQFKPRVAGLDYTAPAYDKVAEPKEAPYPAACVLGASGWCQCWSQQGTKLQVPLGLCGSIAKGGFFVAWNTGNGNERQHLPTLQPVARQRDEVPSMGSLGNSEFGRIKMAGATSTAPAPR